MVFYGGALAGLIFLLLFYKKMRPERSRLLLEADAGGFYHPLTGGDVHAALVRSPGFWAMIAVVVFMFAISIFPIL